MASRKERPFKLLLALLVGKEGHILVPSRSRPGQHHSVDLSVQKCTCEDFVRNKKVCWHLRELNKLNETQVTLPP